MVNININIVINIRRQASSPFGLRRSSPSNKLNNCSVSLPSQLPYSDHYIQGVDLFFEATTSFRKPWGVAARHK